MSFFDKMPTVARVGSGLRRAGGFFWKMAKRWVRPVVFTLVCLVTLVALYMAEENYRTDRAWEAYKTEAKTRGVKFKVAELAPPPVPDDQNFAMTPLLKPLLADRNYPIVLGHKLDLNLNYDVTVDYVDTAEYPPNKGDWETGQPVNLAAWALGLRQPVLEALKKFDPEMAEISAAARRPYSRFPIPYDTELAVSILLPQVSTLISLGRLFELRGAAGLAAGQSEAALEDTLTLLRLSQATRDEPTFISKLTGMQVLKMGLQTAWEGLAARAWSDEQLAWLQGELQKIDILPQLLPAEQGERAFFNDTLEWLGRQDSVERVKIFRDFLGSQDKLSPLLSLFRIPRFFLNNLLLVGNQYVEESTKHDFQPAERRFYPESVRASEDHLQQLAEKSEVYALVKFFLTSRKVLFTRFAQTQTSLEEAALACALERYRLAEGKYPDKLEALAPKFFVQLPHDLITGGPLHYQLTDNGRYLLYSTGWTGKDNGGKLKDKDNFDIAQDNWVWRYPAK